MARRCKISKVGPQAGHRVSHANNKTKRIFEVNLQSKKFFDAESKKFIRVKVSTRMIRTISKLGLREALKKNGLTIADVAAR
jgi:large subunit ribosomal protein L28